MTLPSGLDRSGPEATPDSVLSRLEALLPELTGARRRIAVHLLADLPAGAHTTIVELASQTETSPATVTRFCRALGFDGYSALRLKIAMETGRAVGAGWDLGVGREVAPSDPIDTVAGIVMAADVRAIQDTVGTLDLPAVEQVADRIAVARRVDLYGLGNSATIGHELQLRLYRIGAAAWAWSDVHDGLASAALLRPGDVALALSHSGRTTETVDMLSEAHARGAMTVAITSFPRSPLAQIADVALRTSAHETTFRPGSVSARHSQLTVVDLLYIAVAQRTQAASVNALEGAAGAVARHRVHDPPRPRRHADALQEQP